MKIGVIGAGWLGGTVGKIWVQAGHDVCFSSRHPEKYARLSRDLGPRASVGTIEEAAKFGEVALISVPYRALSHIARDLSLALRGKIVFDACNPHAPDPAELMRAVESQGVALATAEYFPQSRLVRVFSAVDATAIEASAEGRSAPLGVPLASDDDAALRLAETLVRDAGCEPVIVGGLADARSFQRGGPGFRFHTDAAGLRRRLGLPQAI